jgi:hypothetical protein
MAFRVAAAQAVPARAVLSCAFWMRRQNAPNRFGYRVAGYEFAHVLIGSSATIHLCLHRCVLIGQ